LLQWFFVSIILCFLCIYHSQSNVKVIVGAHAIMANGGVIAPVGMNMVALAAQRHAVPFVVVAGSHKV
jgi:translation initiation factor 2B subunit (eIF-2B alpha/beta/delta family)